MKKLSIQLLSLWLIFLLSEPVDAYMDAGSSSMILQLILGGITGLVVVLKLSWHRILRLFGINKDEESDSLPKSPQ